MNFSIWFRQAVLALDSCTWNMFRPPSQLFTMLSHLFKSTKTYSLFSFIALFEFQKHTQGERERERRSRRWADRCVTKIKTKKSHWMDCQWAICILESIYIEILCVSNICHGRHTDDLIWQHYLRCTVYTARVRWIIKSEIVSMAIKFV